MPSIICQNIGGNAYIPYLSCLYGYNKRYTLVGVPKEMCQKEERDRIKEGTSGKVNVMGAILQFPIQPQIQFAATATFRFIVFLGGPIVKSLASFGASKIYKRTPPSSTLKPLK